MKKYIYTLILTVCLFATSFGQNFWTGTESPGSGNIQVMASNSQDHIYGGSFDGMFRSTDNGESWQQLSPETFAVDLNILAIGINSMDHIYVSTSSGILYKSTDDGNSWANITGELSVGGLNAIVFDSSDNVYLGTFGGLFKSTDAGTSWNLLTGLPDFTGINDIAVDDNGEIFTATTNGVHQSTDDGATWNNITSDLPFSEIQNIELGPSTGKQNLTEVFVAIIGGGIFKYNRITNAWLAYAAGLNSLLVYSMAINALGDIYAGTPLGLYVYFFGASAWTLVNMPTLTTFFIAAILINKLGHIFVAEDWGGVHRSTDGGLNWLRKSIGLTAYSINLIYFSAVLQTLFVSSNSGFWYKTLGQQWAQIVGPFAFFFPQKMVATADYLFIGTFGGMWKMNWLTGEWTDISNGLTSSFITAIVVTALGHIFVGTFDGVFRTIDNGANWEQLVVGLTTLFVVSLALHPAGYLFAATSGGGVFKMDLALLTWVAVITGLPNLFVSSIMVNPAGILFATVLGAGIFRSADLGLLWVAAIVGLTIQQIEYLASRPLQRTGASKADDYEIYAAGADKIFRSTDDGDNWVEEIGGTRGLRISALGADSNGVIYAGTSGGGLLQNGLLTYIQQTDRAIPTDFILEQNYPNPFNPSTKFEFSITESGFTELKIYNSLGQVVETLVNEELPAGSYVFNWSAEGLPSGVYFYNIRNNDFNQTKKAILLK